ncbi:AraC family transcriptional regulator [Botrimarina hoheduenensis]|uniref:Xylose operon regulatory protein n=1 Tax=Botrimarina hoheduenensis TaxID=2528000 RepID=A0A5C5WFH0_9BACT|nr:DNA-binding transcriptional regulator [Botrimarina hoheduenensis]TWT48829.1 Xylose operon regulatory protein [Botrimarina hoheduenensis]
MFDPDPQSTDPFQARVTRSASLKQVAVLVETDSSAGCRVIRGIANYADRYADWHLLIDPRDHNHRPVLPDGWQGHGIIARPTSPQELAALQASGLPLVNVDDLVAEEPKVASVLTDEEELADMALGHLLDRGFRTFAYFAPPSLEYSKRRRDAFVTRLAQDDRPCHEYKPGYRAGRRIGWAEQQRRVERWIRGLPTPIAVLAVDAPRARQLAEICHLAGVRVPDDVAILAGSLDELMCDVSTPPLSSINVASERIGHDAAQLLDQLMNGAAPPTATLLVPPRGVNSRQSTDLLAIDDEEIVDALRYIRNNAHRGIVVEDILRQVPISRRSLEIQFRKYLGRSPAREIRRVQLERSRDLLGRRELSITEVALACGFANATRFGVAFKKDTGKTPYAFRKELLSGQPSSTLNV